MQEAANEIVSALKEISTKLDNIDEKIGVSNTLLAHLCQCEDGKNEREIQRLKEFTESVETMKRETAKFQQELENRYKTELSRIPLFQHER